MNFATAAARLFAAGMLIAIAYPAAAQQAYPSKPIRFITPYGPGGGTDITARLVGQKLAEGLGQQVIVDNRPGGNTIIGTDAVAKSAPDGYTIMINGTNHVLMPYLLPTPYDAIKDFAPVATLSSYEQILVVHPSIPARNLQELMALARSKPGQLNYATAGTGSSGHLTIELLSSMTGIKMQHIPYKGTAPALTDLMSGQVQLFVAPPASSIRYITSGRLRGIAVSGGTRLPALPAVPTFTEAGLPGFEVKGWYAIFAPAGTPKAVVDKLSAEFAKILAMPDIREKIASQGMNPFISTPEEFAALVKADSAKWGKVIKTANIKFEN